jgi:hypothetical protein
MTSSQLRISDGDISGTVRAAYERKFELTLMDLPGFVDSVRWTRERYVVAGIQLRSMPITNQEIPMLPVCCLDLIPVQVTWTGHTAVMARRGKPMQVCLVSRLN